MKEVSFWDALLIVTMLVSGVVIVLGMGYIIVGSFDTLSLQTIGQDKVPCIDERGRPFENELCVKKLTCSKLGIASTEGRCYETNSSKKLGGKN